MFGLIHYQCLQLHVLYVLCSVRRDVLLSECRCLSWRAMRHRGIGCTVTQVIATVTAGPV